MEPLPSNSRIDKAWEVGDLSAVSSDPQLVKRIPFHFECP